MVYGTYSQQRRNGCMCCINLTIGKNDVVYPFIHCRLGFLAQLIQCLTQTFRSSCCIEQHRQFHGIEPFIANVAQYIKLRIVQNRVWQTHHLTMRFTRQQDVGSYSSDIFRQRHHQFLTYRIDWRIGHLRKLLTEIIEQYLRLVGQHSQRSIITHGSCGFGPIHTHRSKRTFYVFASKSECTQATFIIRYRIGNLTATA